MNEAKRFNEGKPKLAYILEFPSVAEAVSRIMEFGAAKYEDGNWKLGGKPDREYLDSMMRHLRLWLEGEVYDQDSGCSHLGHAIWNLMALQQLNHKDEVIDEKVFSERCEYWQKKQPEGVDISKPISVEFKIGDCAKYKPTVNTGVYLEEMDKAQGCHTRLRKDK